MLKFYATGIIKLWSSIMPLVERKVVFTQENVNAVGVRIVLFTEFLLCIPVCVWLIGILGTAVQEQYFEGE